jgi:hypothetical protein
MAVLSKNGKVADNLSSDDELAARRFPGPDYLEVLGWLHQDLKPVRYLEIGVLHGGSLRLARAPTVALGIDPNPKTDGPWNAETRIVKMTSREFFASESLPDPWSLAFVDGYHLFEQVLDDVCSLERYAGPDSLLAIHDTIPLSERTATRTRSSMFYTGDVWKIVPFLALHRKDLDITTVRTAPTGLTLIRNLKAGWEVDRAAVRQFSALPWKYFEDCHGEFLATIENTREDVERWRSCRRLGV